MYSVPHYKEQDPQAIFDFIKAHPFALVTGLGDSYPVATHIPLEVTVKDDGKVFLCGHMMRKSDHHQAFSKNEHVLAIFNGPHGYVSASWYSTPALASTWNYMTVHARGKISFLDEEGTYEAVKAITEKYEGTDTPASFDRLSPEYINPMLKAIVAFTIEVISLDNVFKLSQNRDLASRKNIIAKLYERGDAGSAGIAREMEKRLPVSN